MARGNKYTCEICGTGYEYCPTCSIAKPSYDAERFCSKTHADIAAILSKYGCNLISADEAFKELSVYNLDEITLAERILSDIEKIKAEIGVKVEKTTIVEKPEVTVEEIAEEQSTTDNNKNKKKKW